MSLVFVVFAISVTVPAGGNQRVPITRPKGTKLLAKSAVGGFRQITRSTPAGQRWLGSLRQMLIESGFMAPIRGSASFRIAYREVGHTATTGTGS